MSFLNATLKPKRKIVTVDIKKTDIEKQLMLWKFILLRYQSLKILMMKKIC
nr:hypothetical protein [Clostridium cuniculi]